MNETLTPEETCSELRAGATPIAITAVAALGVVVAALWGRPLLALASAPVVAGAAAAAVVDARTQRIPRRIIYLAAAVGVPLLMLAAATTSSWGDLARAGAGAAAVGAGFLALVLISPRSLGMGDVRLATLLAAFAGYESWAAVAGIAVLPALLAVPAALGRLIRGRSDAIALGPYLLAAYLITLVAPHWPAP